MTESAILIAVGCGAILYFVVCNRAIHFAHPLRIEMIELAERLIADRRVNDACAERIELSLSNVYSTTVAWLYVILLPIAVVLTLYDEIRGRKSELESIPRDLRTDFARLTRLSTVCTLANSPLAFILFVFETSVAAVLFFPVGRAIQHLFSVTQGSQQLLHISGRVAVK